jgi:hypothetical protein
MNNINLIRKAQKHAHMPLTSAFDIVTNVLPSAFFVMHHESKGIVFKGDYKQLVSFIESNPEKTKFNGYRLIGSFGGVYYNLNPIINTVGYYKCYWIIVSCLYEGDNSGLAHFVELNTKSQIN